MSTTGSIYTLTDPRDGTIRYVGKTTKQLSERLAGHLASPTNPAMRLWINTLAAQRMVPFITLVATASNERLGVVEEQQIRRHAKLGHRLFNAPYYQQHLHDLTAPPALSPPRPEPRTAPRKDSLRAFHEKQYGAIARSHAAGRMPARYAAALVAVLALGVVAYMVLRLRVVQAAAASVLCWMYLMSVGFGPLVDEQILPRLPVAQAVGFWDAYLAAPLAVIALHVLAGLYITALTAYGDVRRRLPKVAAVRVSREPDAVDLAARAAADLDGAVLEVRTP